MAKLAFACRGAITVIRKRPVFLWAVAAWPYIVLGLIFLILGFILRAYRDPNQQTDPVTLWRSMGVLAKFGVVFAYVACISVPHGLAAAGTTVIVWAELQGHEAGLRSVFSLIARILLRLLALSLLVGAVCMFAGMFFVVPGVIVFALLSFTIPVLVLEDATVLSALSRGLKLASTQIGTLFGLYTIVFGVVVMLLVLCGVVGFALSSVNVPDWVPGTALWFVWGFFASILVMGSTAVVVHLYRDVTRQQGVPGQAVA